MGGARGTEGACLSRLPRFANDNISVWMGYNANVCLTFKWLILLSTYIQVIHTVHLHQNFIYLHCVLFAMPGCAPMSTLIEADKPLSQQNGSDPRLSQITKSTEVKRSRSPHVTPRRKTKWVKWIKVAPSKAKGTFFLFAFVICGNRVPFVFTSGNSNGMKITRIIP